MNFGLRDFHVCTAAWLVGTGLFFVTDVYQAKHRHLAVHPKSVIDREKDTAPNTGC